MPYQDITELYIPDIPEPHQAIVQEIAYLIDLEFHLKGDNRFIIDRCEADKVLLWVLCGDVGEVECQLVSAF